MLSWFVKSAFTAIVFSIEYSLLTPIAVFLNQACVSFLSLGRWRSTYLSRSSLSDK